MGKRFIEENNIVSGFVPVDMQTAANDADYVSLKDYGRCAVVFYKAVGTAGDDPTITITQAQDVAGTGDKALNFTTIFTKQGADLEAVGTFTIATQTAANTYTDATSAELQAIWVIEFNAEDLDVDNGFTTIKASVGDVGANAQLGCLLYFMSDGRYPEETPVTAIAD